MRSSDPIDRIAEGLARRPDRQLLQAITSAGDLADMGKVRLYTQRWLYDGLWDRLKELRPEPVTEFSEEQLAAFARTHAPHFREDEVHGR